MTDGNDRGGGFSWAAAANSSGMMIALAVLGIFAVGPRGGSNAPSTSPPIRTNGSGTTEERIDAPSNEPALAVLREHFGRRPRTPPTTSTPGADATAAADDGLCTPAAAWRRQIAELSEFTKRPNVWMECVVATVPDPVDSHFQLSFDHAVASLAAGFERHGFVIDRFRFPWTEDLDRLSSRGGDPNRRLQVAREQPGAMLFRRNYRTSDQIEMTDLCLVLLVGEAPTFGVHRRALAAALDLAAAVEASVKLVRHDAWNSPLVLSDYPLCWDSQIRLLGPTYSGSAGSLRQTLELWWDEQTQRGGGLRDLQVSILSGSATADSNLPRLTFQRAGRAETKLTCEFRATVLPDSVLVGSALHHIQATCGVEPHQIALLSEKNTSYGSALASNPGKMRVLPFPMSLSRIRSEYERSGERQGDRRAVPGERRNLDVSFEIDPFAVDVLPQYSRATSAATDVMLDQILATIARDDIRAVVIFGTDVRDKLFLARKVRENAPDVQLVMIESHVLFSHADYTQTLRGTIVASSYPLFTRSQSWTTPRLIGEPTPQFPSDSDQGLYNATVASLNRIWNARLPLLDYAHPFSAAPEHRGPSCWLTVVGDRSLWPVAVQRAVDVEPTASYVYRPAEAEEAASGLTAYPQPPTGVLEPAIHFFVVAFCLALTLVNLPPFLRSARSQAIAEKLRRIAPWIAFAARSTNPPASPAGRETARRAARRADVWKTIRHSLILYGLVAVLLLIVLVTASPLLLHRLHFSDVGEAPPASADVAFGLSIAALFALALATLVIGYEIGRQVHAWGAPWQTQSSDASTGGPNVAAFAVLALALPFVPTGVALVRMNRVSDADAAIYAERAGTFSSGVSPVVPLVLIGFVLVAWALANLRRRWFLQRQPLVDPFGDVESTVAQNPAQRATIEGFAPVTADLRTRLARPVQWFRETRDWCVLPLFTLAIAYVAWRWIATPEGTWFDSLFGPLACLAAFAVAAQIVRLQSVARVFDRLLQRLARHPIAPAFSRVPQRLAAKAGAQLFGSIPKPADMEPLVRSARWLVDHAPEGGRACPQLSIESALEQVEQIESLYARIVGRREGETRDGREPGGELNERIGRFCREYATPELVRYWGGRRAVSAAAADDAVPSDPWIAEAELLVAMQEVDLIRQTFAHLQNLMAFLLIMLMGLLWCVNSYPFATGNLLLSLCFGGTLWAAVVAIGLLLRFNRNEVLSRLNRTTPNRVTFDRTLVVPVVTYVVVPLLGLLAARFPTVSAGLFHWVEVLQQLLRT